MADHLRRAVAALFVSLVLSPALASQQTINVGSAANDGSGDTLRAAFAKTNANFAENYASVSTLTTALAGKAASVHTHVLSDVTGLVAALAGKQPLDATLTGIAALTAAVDQMIYATGADAFATVATTTFGRSLLGSANAAAAKASLALVKADVGLGSVDNTADTAKPISTAQQTALNLKADLASPSLTGTPTAPSAVAGTNTTQVATTAFVATAVSTAAAPRSYLAGLGLANNATDATNDIDIAVGVARDSTNADTITLAAALTKQLDASWAVGTNQGCRDTGAISDATWHYFVVKRPDTGVVDVLCSLSATAPTMPTNYTLKRRIGSVLRVSGSIKAFLQVGDEFRIAQVLDLSTAVARSLTLLTLSVPTGVVVRPLFTVVMQQNVAGDIISSIAPGANNALTTYVINTNLNNDRQLNSGVAPATDTSGRIYLSIVIGSGTMAGYTFYTTGWIDRRGRDD